MKKIFVAVLFLSSVIKASDKPYYFYNPDQEYGSELRFSPFTLWVNGSFDILRNGGHYKDIFKPNFGLHLIGNGMQFVKLSEWYDYHQYSYPKLLSFATTTTYHLFNEIFENGSFKGTNVDPISDILIFNPLGMLLFSTSAFKEFFFEKLPLLDWSLQRS